MKETRMPPLQSANLAANSGNTIYGVGVIGIHIQNIERLVNRYVTPVRQQGIYISTELTKH